MMIEDALYHRYTVPFRVPFVTSTGLQQHRDGLLVQLRDRDGRIGHGEAVALTSFGTATVDVLERKLAELVPRIKGSSEQQIRELLADFEGDLSLAPVRFAVDTALLDLDSEASATTLSRYLDPDAATEVPLNATISDMDPDAAATAAGYAAMAGYQAIKMKVGAFADASREVERVAAVRDAIGPATGLRLDVNGAWSIERAIEIARMLEPYTIEYLEQPLPPGDIGALAYLRSEVGIPIAVDESVTSEEVVKEMIDREAIDVAIIKPTIIGGLTASRELIELASKAGVRVVVTTAIETGVAIAAALHLAATLPKPIPPCGLATGTLLETDLLVDSPVIRSGRMLVPDRPGLGVQPRPTIWNDGDDDR